MLLLCGHHYIQSNTNKMHTLHSTRTHVGWRCGFSWVINADSLVFANSSQLCAVMTPGYCKQLCTYVFGNGMFVVSHTHTVHSQHTHTPKTHTHTHTHTTNWFWKWIEGDLDFLLVKVPDQHRPITGSRCKQ